MSETFQINKIIQSTPLTGFAMSIGEAYKDVIKNATNLTNPPDIVKFTDSGFDINMNNMVISIPYIIVFEDTMYAVWKNDSGQLVMKELG